MHGLKEAESELKKTQRISETIARIHTKSLNPKGLVFTRIEAD